MTGDPPEKAKLGEDAQPLYPAELAHAYRLIVAAADRIEREGDRYDAEAADALRGVARAVDRHGAGIARGKAVREGEATWLRRAARRFAKRP